MKSGYGRALLFYCRRGFERDCAAEVQANAQRRGIEGYLKAKENSAHVLFLPHVPDAWDSWAVPPLNLTTLAFARQQILVTGPLQDIPGDDRISPLLDQAACLLQGQPRNTPRRYRHMWLETADTNEAKELSVFLKKFQRPLQREALNRRLLMEQATASPHDLVSHLFFLDSSHAWVGISQASNASPWPGGIPRLRFPRGAPSRSTLKLEEAFLTFLKDPEHALQPAMQAVDLGAAPGGWTWQLVRRHLRIAAIDNGSMDPALLESGLVEHFRSDGFRYRPRKPVDWMVCDMVEQPVRIARLVTDWLTEGQCRYTIFNLKLPMKKRYDELQRCHEMMHEKLQSRGLKYELRFRQLYHDREEVTGFCHIHRIPVH
ncbi:MAG: hypothetical protein RIQ52_1834 [Pseudomonadota bacterium]|jgi:23S rRNA (cytidine2498-2'-O)-methyltransferase